MSYPRQISPPRGVLAHRHATAVITGRRTGVHTTLMSETDLLSLAKELSTAITITATNKYEDYTSLVYEIDCLQNKIFVI